MKQSQPSGELLLQFSSTQKMVGCEDLNLCLHCDQWRSNRLNYLLGCLIWCALLFHEPALYFPRFFTPLNWSEKVQVAMKQGFRFRSLCCHPSMLSPKLLSQKVSVHKTFLVMVTGLRLMRQ